MLSEMELHWSALKKPRHLGGGPALLPALIMALMTIWKGPSPHLKHAKRHSTWSKADWSIFTHVLPTGTKDDDDDVHSAPCSLQPIGVGHTGSCLYEAMLRLIEFSDWEMPPS